MDKKSSLNRNENGMIVVEAVISFTAFIMVCLMITFLINIFMLHNRVQFAINSAASEIASYSYLYEVTGLREGSETIQKDAEKATENLDGTLEQVMDTVNKFGEASDAIKDAGASAQGNITAIGNFDFSSVDVNSTVNALNNAKGAVGATWESGKQSMADIKSLFSDPSALMAAVIYAGIDIADYALKHLVGMGAAWALTSKYLKEEDRSADAYLRAYGVIDGYDGLDFTSSSVFADDGNRMVDIVVKYKIDLSFVNFVLPGMEVEVVQRSTVGAWLNGDGGKVK